MMKSILTPATPEGRRFISFWEGDIKMVNIIISVPRYCSRIICSERFVLWFFGILRIVSITSQNQLKKTCMAKRGWFENRDSNNYSVDTSKWESKTMLTSSLRDCHSGKWIKELNAKRPRPPARLCAHPYRTQCHWIKRFIAHYCKPAPQGEALALLLCVRVQT